LLNTATRCTFCGAGGDFSRASARRHSAHSYLWHAAHAARTYVRSLSIFQLAPRVIWVSRLCCLLPTSAFLLTYLKSPTYSLHHA